MQIETAIDRLHRKTVHSKALQLFTAFTRVLLALAFIPPSIPKILHKPFTILPTSNPVGHYFDALYKTGFYYDFIGWCQITAAILLIIPRTSHLGALLFLPIVINITVLTNSIGFRGTWLITILMSCACLYLVCWDYPRWKSLLFPGHRKRPGFTLIQLISIPVVFAAITLTMLLAAGLLTGRLEAVSVGVLTAGGFVFGTIVAIHRWFMVIDSVPGTAK